MSNFDPGPGWREISGNEEQIGGREYIVHAWLERPFDSYHQQRAWVRVAEDAPHRD